MSHGRPCQCPEANTRKPKACTLTSLCTGLTPLLITSVSCLVSLPPIHCAALTLSLACSSDTPIKLLTVLVASSLQTVVSQVFPPNSSKALTFSEGALTILLISIMLSTSVILSISIYLSLLIFLYRTYHYFHYGILLFFFCNSST